MKEAQYEILLRVQSDPGVPLAAAVARHAGKIIGVTAETGSIMMKTTGKEGGRVAVDITCPEGFRSPAKPILITLHSFSELGRRPEYAVACPPLKRKLVVAVRLDGAPHASISHLGKELGRADEAGSAHVFLEGVPEETLELTIDTTHNAALRPRSPTARFKVGSRDEVLLLNQSFETVIGKPKSRPRSVPAEDGPVRIH